MLTYCVIAGASTYTYTPPSAPCQCSLYCNYCDKTHREMFGLTAYSSNSTYDEANKAQVTEDLYSMDDVKRNYETYMDYYCGNLYDSRKLSSLLLDHTQFIALQARPACSVTL